MDLKTIYDLMPGDYGDVMNRLVKEERIKKYLLKFRDNNAVSKLEIALEEKDVNEAFLHAHTLKGLCANLSVSALLQSASDLTENLRGKTIDENTGMLFDKVKSDYEKVMKALMEID